MPTDFTSDSRFEPHADVQARVLDGEAVLLNIRTGAYFGLNVVSTHIWELYGEGKTLAEVVDGVLDRFEVECQQAEGDVRDFTQTLVERELLLPV